MASAFHQSSLSLPGKRAPIHSFATPHQLCAPCRQLCSNSKSLATLPGAYERWSLDRQSKKPLYVPEPQCERYSHHNFSSLDMCRSNGHCHLCAIFWSELTTEDGQQGPLKRLQALEDRNGKGADGMVVLILHGGRSIVNHCLLSFEIDGRRTKADMQLVMSIEPFTAPVKTSFSAQLAFSTGSDPTIVLTKQWLDSCLMNHYACGNVGTSSDSVMTPRVIDSRKLDPSTPYLTLSHCWGNAKFLKLTSNNIDLLMSRIPFQELSKTHQDSLSITRRLGYRFIWIDSLCIVQDSTEDWRIESANMASVYGNSTCNIAAKGATSDSGCFVHRNPLILRPCQLTQTSTIADSTQGVYAHPYSTASYQSFNFYNYDTGSPLLNRAWVQQERLLPPRLLYFGGQEIHWECCSLQASETWPFGPPSGERSFDELYPLKAAFESELRPYVEWTSDDLCAFIFELWRNGITRQYTAAELTFEKDRLAALAGIASVIQARTGLSYVAGLWKELLPLELLWVRDAPLTPGQNYRIDSKSWKAPTWSWVSVLGKKRYSIGALGHVNMRRETYSCQVVDCMTQSLDTNTPILGEFSEASLTLKGYLAPRMKLLDDLSLEQIDLPQRAAFVNGLSIFFDINLAIDEAFSYFLVTRNLNKDVHFTDYGLVLVQDALHLVSSHVRVGCFVHSYNEAAESLFNGCEEQTILIF